MQRSGSVFHQPTSQDRGGRCSLTEEGEVLAPVNQRQILLWGPQGGAECATVHERSRVNCTTLFSIGFEYPQIWVSARGLEGLGKPPRRKRICLQCKRPRFDPWVGKIPWRRTWQPTPVFLPGRPPGEGNGWDFPGVGCHCLLPYLCTSLPK